MGKRQKRPSPGRTGPVQNQDGCLGATRQAVSPAGNQGEVLVVGKTKAISGNRKNWVVGKKPLRSTGTTQGFQKDGRCVKHREGTVAENLQKKVPQAQANQ